ncbi:hypothetical protein ACIQWA_24830 [Kitasatospora sp. NPDC098652]|uniref:hypothetical protein n=1 Tax=Kitasatospora sp. NPDC098652 TaxID=3364095 RepID=UPI00382B5CB0
MRGRRWRTLLLGVVLPLVLTAGAVGGLYWLREWDRHPAADSGRPGSWVTVGSAEVAAFARVRVPGSAGELRWAYRKGLQDDVAFLFRLPPGEEQGFLNGLGIPLTPDAGTDLGSGVLEGFRQAGAPDPRAAGALRHGSVVADALPGRDKRLAESAWLAEEADGGTRVWVHAVDAP